MRATVLPPTVRTSLVMFVDLVGYFPRTWRLSTRDLADHVAPLLGEMLVAACEAGGTPVRTFGDAILLVFDEAALPSLARAAFSAATGMCSIARQHGYELRIGMNFGPVAHVTLALGVYEERMLVGRAVDIAAFIQRAARPGVPLVSQQIANSLRRVIGLGRSVAVNLKGLPVEIVCYEIDLE